jgi:hypothetical protein
MTQQVIDGRHAVLVHVDRFGNGAHAYWANVDSSFAVRSVAGYNSVSFGVKGSGLRTIRLYVENGPSERWRSPPVPVTLSWTESTVRLQDFDHQSRPGATDLWRIAGASRPDRVERFSFKLGSFVNEQSARGTVAIADLRLSTH